jgi:O-antigen/teichoic acid export membrane protein
MLGNMMPDKIEVGIYSAATAVAQMWFFVPMAIIISFKPVIISKKKQDEQAYLNTLQLLYTIVAWLGICFGVFILIFSNHIISILYGASYQKAASILSISVWAGTFAMLGSARSLWSLTEGFQKYTVFYAGIGTVTNIILNYLLIPLLSGYGAAIATLISQITVAIVAPAMIKETRISAVMILKSFVPSFK